MLRGLEEELLRPTCAWEPSKFTVSTLFVLAEATNSLLPPYTHCAPPLELEESTCDDAAIMSLITS